MTTATSDEGTEPKQDTEGKQGTEDKGTGNSEAAKWRIRLRAVEAERDGLAARVAAFTRAEVERHAAPRLADPDDLFSLGKVEVADLLDDEGEVDPEKVEQAVTDLLERKPRLARNYEPDADGFDGGARKSVSNSPPTWGSVLGGRR